MRWSWTYVRWRGGAESLCAYVCDYSDYVPCTLRSGAKQDLTYYFLLPADLIEDWTWTWSNYKQEWVVDDSVYMCFVAVDFIHLGPPTTIYHDYHTPLIPITPDDLVGYAWMTQPFDDTLRNPVWSGYEWTYGPAAEDDGPAPFAVAKFETCYPPDKITLRIAGRQNMEEIGQGLGNAYEEQDVKDAGYTGWDDPRIKFYDHPPVLLFDTLGADPRPFLHTDAPQPEIMRLNGFEYTGESTGFTVAWDGRQWPWTLGPKTDETDALERNGLPYYPPGRYTLTLDLKIADTNVSLDAGVVDLVYGGSLMDGNTHFIFGTDRLRQIREQYDSVFIQSLVYASPGQGDAASFSFKTFSASRLYSPVFHYDGHSPVDFHKGQETSPPCRKDLVFMDCCSGFSNLADFDSCTRAFMGWNGNIFAPYANVWSGYFYEGLFDLVDDQARHYSIRKAYDYANVKTDIGVYLPDEPVWPEGYISHRYRVTPYPELWEREAGDADRRVGDFEKTSW